METDRTISASTVSDNVSFLNRNNGTHQCLQYLMALDRWTRYEWIYQLLECLILLDCWSGTEWAISASTGSDNVSLLNRNKVTHQCLQYLKALDRWARNEWIYQLPECLIILDCWTGSEWDISAYRVHDDVSFWTQAWVPHGRTYTPPNDGIAGWSINQGTKIYVRHKMHAKTTIHSPLTNLS